MPNNRMTRKEASEPTPIVTFYSYKGGVGRSMAVLNVASLIASRGFRVLIIDFDLEAPGLSHLLGKDAIPAKKQAGRKAQAAAIRKDGVVELLSDAALRGAASDLLSKPFSQIAGRYTFAYKPPLGLKQRSGASLFIMPSGRLDEGYSARLDALDLPGLYNEAENSGKRLILRLREILIHSGLYDYILVDSRTGHSDEAGICTRDLADHRMVVSGLNTQNISGTAAFLHNLRIALTQDSKPLKTPDIILSPIPNGEDDMVAEREKVARHEFQKAWRGDLEINLLIPYHPRLALTEEAYVPSITASPLRSAYLAIEGRLLQSLGHVPRALDDRFRKTVISGEGPAALHVFRQLIRLLRTPQYPGQAVSHAGFQFRLGYDEDLLKQILRLDEALDILKLYAENTSVSFEATAIAKKIHSLSPTLVQKFDSFLLTLDQLHPDELGNYAIFLKNTRKDHDAAEAFYKRAIDADPKHANNLGNYANFLADIRKDHDAAEAFYKRAIDADPKDAIHLGNYGQFLIGRARAADGLQHLRSAWRNLDMTRVRNTAELAYSLWLGSCLTGSEEPVWERVFKQLIEKGFPRPIWNFASMLAEAEKKLRPADFKYAKALAAAFLDESQVAALEKFPRWKKLQPLDPALINPDGTIREPKKA
jgi:MinD-like ATPase involved in chromosome partitioning or flagellar assembly